MHPRPACLPAQGKGKARKRQRTGEQVEPVAAATKKAKKVQVQSPAEAVSTQSEQNSGTAAAPRVPGSGEQAGEPQQPTKYGFFSGKKFSELPLSKDMLATLDSLNFKMATKVQASCCRSRHVHADTVTLFLEVPSSGVTVYSKSYLFTWFIIT